MVYVEPRQQQSSNSKKNMSIRIQQIPTSISSFFALLLLFLFYFRIKCCDKCQELELTIEQQRKANQQLKISIEQKQTDKPRTTSIPQQQQQQQQQQCDDCDDFKRLVDYENNNQTELKQQIQKQIQLLQQEKQNKSVRFLFFLFLFKIFSFVFLQKKTIEQKLQQFQNELIEQKHLTDDLQRQKQQYQVLPFFFLLIIVLKSTFEL